MQLTDIIDLLPMQQIELAEHLHLSQIYDLSEPMLVFAILEKIKAKKNEIIIADGILDIMPDGYGFFRLESFNFVEGPYDIYVSPKQIQKFRLEIGDHIEGEIRAPKDNENYCALLRIAKINDEYADVVKDRLNQEISDENFIDTGCDALLYISFN